MADHTPTPWVKCGRAIVGQGREIAHVHTAFGIWDMNEANLNLMVAAPEMLEALEAAVAILCGESKCTETVHAWMYAAIAKAKGE